MTLRAALIVGIGSPDAGDDAVGPAVAEVVRARAVVGVEVLVHEDPTDLSLLWRDRELVVVIDAVRSGEPPGIVRTEVVREKTAAGWPSGRSGGTHDFGLGSAVALSRALGTLPELLVLVGVEGRSFAPGDPMTAAVRAAVPTAVDAVLAVCRQGVGV